MTEELLKRLEATNGEIDPRHSVQAYLRNPDGPEAAALIRQLKADAERYQYLRGRDPGPDGELPSAGLFIGIVPENMILTEEDADEAIDAVRAAQSLNQTEP